MAKLTGAKIITPGELGRMRRELPQSLIKAAGMMRHKRKALERHIKKVRLEWDRPR